jgi:hypothetical protein
MVKSRLNAERPSIDGDQISGDGSIRAFSRQLTREEFSSFEPFSDGQLEKLRGSSKEPDQYTVLLFLSTRGIGGGIPWRVNSDR